MAVSDKTTGEKIKQARLNSHMTQKQLAEKCGMADSAIRKYESGKVIPKVETLQKIANALGVSVYSIGDFTTSTEAMTAEINNNKAAYGEEYNLYCRMVMAFTYLNHVGAEKAAEAVEALAEINEYRRDEDKF